jgi:ATP-dependent Clp protease protease subunit
MTKHLIEIAALASCAENRCAHKSEYPSLLRLNADETTESAELFIYGEIGTWWGDGPDTQQTVKDLAVLDVSQLDVRINSPGGSVFDGVAIYNALAMHKAHVTVHVEGVAASIASIIAMAGDTIRIGEAANIMIHKPWSFVIGDAEDMRKEADILDTLEGGLIDIYVARTGLDADEVRDFIAEETWFRGQEAVDNGFADELIPSKGKKSAAARSAIYARFRNAPRDLVAQQSDPAIRDFERLIRQSMNISASDAKRIASMGVKMLAAERDAPATAQRDVVQTSVADGDFWKIANHIRKLTK